MCQIIFSSAAADLASLNRCQDQPESLRAKPTSAVECTTCVGEISVKGLSNKQLDVTIINYNIAFNLELIPLLLGCQVGGPRSLCVSSASKMLN